MFKSISKLLGFSHPNSPTPISLLNDHSVQSSSSDSKEIIESLLCFVEDGQTFVALFGSPSDSADGWLRNCPWNEVFQVYPNILPFDQRVSLQEIERRLQLGNEFYKLVKESLSASAINNSNSGPEPSFKVKLP